MNTDTIHEMVNSWKFGIFDVYEQMWLLDCFDNPHGFVTEESANKILTNLKEQGRYIVKSLPEGLYCGEAQCNRK